MIFLVVISHFCRAEKKAQSVTHWILKSSDDIYEFNNFLKEATTDIFLKHSIQDTHVESLLRPCLKSLICIIDTEG